MNLRLAAHPGRRRSRERADALLAEQEAAAAEADRHAGASSPVASTRRCSADEGLVAALRGGRRHQRVPVEVAAVDVGRYAAEVEAAAYFCCLEAVQNAVKHSGATAIRVELLDGADGIADFVVEDDGVGFDPAARSRRHRACPTCATGSSRSAGR